MKAVRHAGIIVSELDKMLHFYKDILGMKIKEETAEAGKYIDTLFDLKGVKVKIVKISTENDNLIELLWFESHPEKPSRKNIPDIGYSHISFTVKDINYEYDRLKKLGIEFNCAPQASKDGRTKVLYCRDPECNFIELVEELT